MKWLRSLFEKPESILFMCTYCEYEMDYLPHEIRILEENNSADPICRFRLLCDICHTGFMIPWIYQDQYGDTFRFHEIKPKIKNLDPDTAVQRIYRDHIW